MLFLYLKIRVLQLVFSVIPPTCKKKRRKKRRSDYIYTNTDKHTQAHEYIKHKNF